MTLPIKPTIRERLTIYLGEASQELVHPSIGNYSLAQNLRVEALPRARAKILEIMKQRAKNYEEADFTYNSTRVVFSQPKDADTVLLELPFGKNSDNHIKYISGEDESGREVTAALCVMDHIDVVKRTEEITGKKLKNIKGGLMLARKSKGALTVKVCGYSETYGRADHNHTIEILRSKGLEAHL